MMKLRLFLRSSAKNALNSLILIILLLFSGCSSSLTPTYLKENIDKAIQDICKAEYNLDVKVKLVGSTLWIYLPLEDIFEKSEKPEKYFEKFSLEQIRNIPSDASLKFAYLIRAVPEKEKTQEYKYKKDTIEKINNVWKVLRRVIFSLDRSKETEPTFYYLITADIKNGLEMKELFYSLDLKKVSYEYISWEEYQHRTIQDTDFGAQIIADTEGMHIHYRDITMKEFITEQIIHRIRLKFQKPEVDKNVDIDREIIKVIAATVKIYDFKEFNFVELNNLENNNKLLLSRPSLLDTFNH